MKSKSCARPTRFRRRFEVSLEGLQINDAIHLSALNLPKDVKLTTHEKDFTIATIAVPSAVRSENEAAAAAACGSGGSSSCGGRGSCGWLQQHLRLVQRQPSLVRQQPRLRQRQPRSQKPRSKGWGLEAGDQERFLS